VVKVVHFKSSDKHEFSLTVNSSEQLLAYIDLRHVGASHIIYSEHVHISIEWQWGVYEYINEPLKCPIQSKTSLNPDSRSNCGLCFC